MSDLTLQQLVLRLVAYGFIAAVHGFAVAAATVAMGDLGPRWDDRRSLNPLQHLDIVGTVSGVLFSVGWIRPIAIDPAALRLGRVGLVIIVAIGAAATLASAVALRLLRPWVLPYLSDTVSATAFSWVETVGQLSVWFALFNLLPIPPLTGAHLLTALMPGWDKFLRKIAPYTGLALAVVAATGWFAKVLGPWDRAISRLLFGT
jgi:Zn-dependent protease